MQYYTKQELQGAGRYTGKCRIGNWNENDTLDEVRLKDYIAKKETGSLKMDKFQKRMNTALQKVELTSVVADEYVRFGDVFQLENLSSGAVVSVDVENKDPRAAENSCAVSASFILEPCARNTFTLEKYAPPASSVLTLTYDDDLLHYGQKVKFVVNAAAQGDAAAAIKLKSYPVSTTHFAKFSRFCEVVASGNDSYECVFEVLTPDPTKRLVSEGVPVMAGAPIVLLHSQTNQCLSVEGHSLMNDFGKELELCGHTCASKGNSFLMEGLATGKPLAMSVKAPQDSNIFAIVGAGV
mmetsp:Transcript_18271/g.45445  ORF Transcript_18271/g.45445 Transcript_18271/m.45445 type:complete len:296 (-) Transcript_18271:170-1057(-)|eukprot:CAMPEP_0197574980 /NCGR_PEP_ID=MMETSP1326-20131121/533_1 /TAXON_ID=1155430 /ORGANISM="Genus nov. species nov., Strain RCC2288" /LENGTH=295 /DNA_ID=CAMNT_0043137661 /DNA_START=45 /DNA_END=932 /DNA_ORIENTATION=+